MCEREPTAVILAGGKSRRFGRDKTWVEFKGRPLIEILLATLTDAGFRVILSGPKGRLSELGLQVVEDIKEGSGPLHALLGVWERISAPRILLTACDMPFLKPAVGRLLWEQAHTYDLVLLETGYGVEPLPGVYAKTGLPHIRKLLDGGRGDLKALAGIGLRVKAIPVKTWGPIDPDGESVWNVNTRLELDRLCKRRHRKDL